jgi:exonuclease VII small subunit
MKFENIPADIKSKSLKDAKNEIELILARLEDKNLNLNDNQEDYKRLIYLNRHMENLFKKKFKDISSQQIIKKDDKK